MSLLIKNWQMADWKELLKWAKIGANNAMIGEFAEVEELQPHGRLIDADALLSQYNDNIWTAQTDYAKGLRDVVKDIADAPTIIPAEPCNNLSKPCKEDES